MLPAQNDGEEDTVVSGWLPSDWATTGSQSEMATSGDAVLWLSVEGMTVEDVAAVSGLIYGDESKNSLANLSKEGDSESSTTAFSPPPSLFRDRSVGDMLTKTMGDLVSVVGTLIAPPNPSLEAMPDLPSETTAAGGSTSSARDASSMERGGGDNGSGEGRDDNHEFSRVLGGLVEAVKAIFPLDLTSQQTLGNLPSAAAPTIGDTVAGGQSANEPSSSDANVVHGTTGPLTAAGQRQA